MGVLVRGDIVVVRFPYSDLRDSKRRPALVLADCGGDDIGTLNGHKLTIVLDKLSKLFGL